jgi:hypothetical protein
VTGSRPSYQGAANATDPPVPPDPVAGDGDLVEVFCTVAVRTSAGPDVGPKLVPPAEAASLVGRRMAVYGSTGPRGWPG